MSLVASMGQAVGLWFACVVPGVAFLLFARRRAEVMRLVFRLAPVAVFYFVYEQLVTFTQRPSVVVSALHRGEGIERLERWFGLAWEPRLSHLSIPGAVSYYDYAQVVVVLGVLTWLAVNEGDRFWRCCRNSLALIAAGGFLIFWLLPVSPPWLLPASYGIHSAGLANLRGIGDLLGAFPSLHTAWAGWAAMVLWAVAPGRWAWAGFVNLAVTAVVVITTGNHYVLDVVAGEALAFVACIVADRLERVRHRELSAVASPASSSAA